MLGWIKRAIVLGMLLVLAFGVHWTQKRLDGYRAIHFVDTTPVFLPKGKVLKWFSMGYPSAMADWLWIRSVLYYGRRTIDEDNPYYRYAIEKGNLGKELESVEQRIKSIEERASRVAPKLAFQSKLTALFRFDSRGLVDYLYPLLDRVTTLNPHFIFPYIFGGVYLLMDTGEYDQAEALLQRGYRENPDHWQFPFYLAWLRWMYQGDIPSAQKYLMEAAGKPSAPEYVYSMLKGITEATQTVEVTRSYLESLLSETRSEELRKKIEKLLSELDASSSQSMK